MAALTKNAISVTGRDRAKQTKIWDHKGYKSQITNIFKNSKLYKKNWKQPKVLILETVRNTAKRTEIWYHKSYNM